MKHIVRLGLLAFLVAGCSPILKAVTMTDRDGQERVRIEAYARKEILKELPGVQEVDFWGVAEKPSDGIWFGHGRVQAKTGIDLGNFRARVGVAARVKGTKLDKTEEVGSMIGLGYGKANIEIRKYNDEFEWYGNTPIFKRLGFDVLGTYNTETKALMMRPALNYDLGNGFFIRGESFSTRVGGEINHDLRIGVGFQIKF